MTSPQPSEGKTTVVANLAVAWRGQASRTLLIDADLRRPGADLPTVEHAAEKAFPDHSG